MQYGSQPRRCSPASNPFTLSLEGPRSAPRTRTTFNLQLSTACPEPRGGRPLSMAPLFSSTYALLARSFALPFRATSPESARYALFPRNTRDIYPQSEHPAKVRSRDSGGVHKDSGAGDQCTSRSNASNVPTFKRSNVPTFQRLRHRRDPGRGTHPQRKRPGIRFRGVAKKPDTCRQRITAAASGREVE
jgi:hypothetical protein